jgi:hypothetical protein
MRLGRWSDVEQLHQHLLFLRAFPDDPRVLAAVVTQLLSFAPRVRGLRPADRRRLEDTGIVGTMSRHRFDAPIVSWLIKRFPGQVNIDWQSFDDMNGLEFLLRLALLRAEEDGFDSPALSTRQWVMRAKKTLRETELECVLRILHREQAVPSRWLAVWDQAAVPIAWRLSGRGGAATFETLPATRVAFRMKGLRPTPKQPRRLIATPLRRIELLDRDRARQVIDLARAALTARCREVYAITHANADEVHLADLGEGTVAAIIGTRPEMRLSLESNYGFLLLANGVPIGYGGVTPLYRQANTGINVFEAYRGSEAAMLWTQTLRAFHALFGVNRFIVSPYQFGAGNAEAIASGAFWFYYRLGFRPVAHDVRALAGREHARLRAEPGHRTEVATLKHLAHGDLELPLVGASARERFEEAWLERLGIRVTEHFARAGANGRSAAVVWAQVCSALGIAGWSHGWRDPGPRCLAPLVALVDGVDRWSQHERAALGALLRAKGAAQELGYVRAAQHQTRFFRALGGLARRPPDAKR